MSWVEIKEPNKFMARGADARVILEKTGANNNARCRVQVRKDLLLKITNKTVRWAAFLGEGKNAGKLRFAPHVDGIVEFKTVVHLDNYLFARIGHIPSLPDRALSSPCKAEVSGDSIVIHLPTDWDKASRRAIAKAHRPSRPERKPRAEARAVKAPTVEPKRPEPQRPTAPTERPRRPREEVAATVVAATAARTALAAPPPVAAPKAPPAPPPRAPAPVVAKAPTETTAGDFKFAISTNVGVITYRGEKYETTPRKAQLVQLLVRAMPQPIGHTFLIGKLWPGRQPPDAHMMLSAMVHDLAEPLLRWKFRIQNTRGVGVNLTPIE